MIFFGGISIGAAFLASELGSVLQAALSLAGMTGGPSLATYSMGLFLPFINSYVSVIFYDIC